MPAVAHQYSGILTAGPPDQDVVALPQALLVVYSLDIQHEALGIMRFNDFAVKKTELGKLPGETITFTRYGNITRGGQLMEHEDIAMQTMSASTNTLDVTEYGNAIGLTEKMLQLSFDDMLAEAAVLLGRDYAIVKDLAERDALINNLTNSHFAGGRAAAANLLATDFFDIELLRVAVETLQTQNVPKFMGDFYVCFVHPHQVAYIKRDPDWQAANNYANTRALFNGELGRFEDTIFIGTTHMRNGAAAATTPGEAAALQNAGADGQHLYEALIFGDSCLACATGLEPEMRESGVIDFGRKHGIAWYSIEGFDLLYDNYGAILTTS